MRAATFLLPPRARLPGALPDAVARALGRADALPAGEGGERAQLLRHFELLPRGWPVAALTRQRDAGDAPAHGWLRADPVYARPDINGVRLLAHGETMRLAREDAEAFLPALRPLFGDAGFPIDAPAPTRWYLRLPREARLPAFAEPSEALGADLFEHLPEGPEGRRWRVLLSEAQVILHNHPHNAARVAAGKPPVNSLWFWGGGVLPDHVRTVHAAVHGGEVLLAALAQAAGRDAAPLPACFAPREGALLYDLRAARDPAALAEAWLVPAVEALRRGTLDALELDFEDGARFRFAPRQRWRFWRRPRPAFA
ncbi:phosphoglycerate mutase [Vulcaniibacterium gelatinicum]|uniref:phosphoglycerate mutase n=1 Tax=Vulcaniibacterium gelatinicum TaxID=2598725 RepID=UPI0011C9991D|nr:phosphoglycerate mutase [Vulcaniibacterium gelatinicum]